MKRLPLGIQNFRKLIEGDFVYVDKTQYIYNMLNDVPYYFLSRPRRFGKSLLLDTIAEVFSGGKELFKGLWIYDSDYAFHEHPVIRLDMSNIANKTPEILEHSLAVVLRKYIQDEELDILDIRDEIPSDIFKNLIEDLYKKKNKKIVVLIDEYDKPILDNLFNIDIAEANRRVLRGFYGILKSMDPYLRMTFITGVTKFAKTSVFSEMNNLLDITFSRKYPNICGIAIDELEPYFSNHIKNLSRYEEFKDYRKTCDEILAWYDGYSWDGKNRVINPFSLLSFFNQERFEGFWYASGTPKFLIDLIKKDPSAYSSIRKLKITESIVDMADFDRLEAEPLLFQSGYLTVKEVLPKTAPTIYLLGMQNFEVRDAFNLHVLAAFTENSHIKAKSARLEIEDALRTGDLQNVLEILRSLFASIPYNLHVKAEAYYHSIFYAVMSVLGFDVDAEVSVSKGRIDAALELDDKVYVIEFKYKSCQPGASSEEKAKLFNDALNEAMAQIEGKGYSKKYDGSGKAR
jgi:hypothetical protein